MTNSTLIPFEITTLNTSINGTTASGAPSPTISRQILNIVLTVTIAIVMVGIGCGVELLKLKNHLKKPVGIIVGATSQFIFMPTIAFALAKIFQMGSLQTLALLLIGSAPGGTASNTVAYWIGGDVDLSVSMTTVSSILAFGMMPLLLWIYQFGFSFSLQVPFETIGITLASLLVPIAIGVAIRVKFPRQAPIVLKVLTVVGVLALIAVAVISVVTYNGVYNLTTGQYICATLFPVIGMTLGFGGSSLISLHQPLYLSYKQRKTIAIETGIQNTQLAITIIQLSGFSLEEIGQMVLFPLIYFVSQCAWSIIILIAYRIYLRGKAPNDFHMDVESKVDNQQKDSSVMDRKVYTIAAYEKDIPIPFQTNSYSTADIFVTNF